MEIKWTDELPDTGERRFLCAERFAGQWRFKWKLQRRGEWTTGLAPTSDYESAIVADLRRFPPADSWNIIAAEVEAHPPGSPA